MSDNPNIERLKAAYVAWNETKGGNQDHWLALLGKNVCVRSVGDQSAGLEFAGECRSREEAVSYFTGLLGSWDMIHWTVDHMVADADRIAVFGRCAWTNKATGKDVEVSISHLWTFGDDGATELVEIFDSARAAAAATP